MSCQFALGLRILTVFSSGRLDTQVLENDFMIRFAKFADHSNGLVNAKQFASYLHLPVDHPMAMEIFDIYDSVGALKRPVMGIL